METAHSRQRDEAEVVRMAVWTKHLLNSTKAMIIDQTKEFNNCARFLEQECIFFVALHESGMTQNQRKYKLNRL